MRVLYFFGVNIIIEIREFVTQILENGLSDLVDILRNYPICRPQVLAYQN